MSNRPYNITVPSGTTDKSYQFKQGLLIGQDDYGYSVINMAACGICPSTLSLYTSDNIHPNAAGCILIKDYLKFKLPKEVYLIN